VVKLEPPADKDEMHLRAIRIDQYEKQESFAKEPDARTNVG
jgi:hypothetical protein